MATETPLSIQACQVQSPKNSDAEHRHFDDGERKLEMPDLGPGMSTRPTTVA